MQTTFDSAKDLILVKIKNQSNKQRLEAVLLLDKVNGTADIIPSALSIVSFSEWFLLFDKNRDLRENFEYASNKKLTLSRISCNLNPRFSSKDKLVVLLSLYLYWRLLMPEGQKSKDAYRDFNSFMTLDIPTACSNIEQIMKLK